MINRLIFELIALWTIFLPICICHQSGLVIGSDPNEINHDLQMPAKIIRKVDSLLPVDHVRQVIKYADDIIYFRYTRLINRETGPVIIGIQLKQKEDLARLIQNMNDAGIIYERSNTVE